MKTFKICPYGGPVMTVYTSNDLHVVCTTRGKKEGIRLWDLFPCAAEILHIHGTRQVPLHRPVDTPRPFKLFFTCEEARWSEEAQRDARRCIETYESAKTPSGRMKKFTVYPYEGPYMSLHVSADLLTLYTPRGPRHIPTGRSLADAIWRYVPNTHSVYEFLGDLILRPANWGPRSEEASFTEADVTWSEEALRIFREETASKPPAEIPSPPDTLLPERMDDPVIRAAWGLPALRPPKSPAPDNRTRLQKMVDKDLPDVYASSRLVEEGVASGFLEIVRSICV